MLHHCPPPKPPMHPSTPPTAPSPPLLPQAPLIAPPMPPSPPQCLHSSPLTSLIAPYRAPLIPITTPTTPTAPCRAPLLPITTPTTPTAPYRAPYPPLTVSTGLYGSPQCPPITPISLTALHTEGPHASGHVQGVTQSQAGEAPSRDGGRPIPRRHVTAAALPAPTWRPPFYPAPSGPSGSPPGVEPGVAGGSHRPVPLLPNRITLKGSG